MPTPDYLAYFRTYAAAYERSLGAQVDVAAIRGFFAEAFVGAGPDGAVDAGRNDAAFEKALADGYGFYKAIGTRSMRVDGVDVAPLCEGHDRVRVSYRAGHVKKDGTPLEIPFDVVYLLQRRADGPRIFAFVTGDEMALYRRHGLVGPDGQPA